MINLRSRMLIPSRRSYATNVEQYTNPPKRGSKEPGPALRPRRQHLGKPKSLDHKASERTSYMKHTPARPRTIEKRLIMSPDTQSRNNSPSFPTRAITSGRDREGSGWLLKLKHKA